MSRGRSLLVAQLPGPPLDPPPTWLRPEQVAAWHDIVTAVPFDVFRRSDSIFLAVVARQLAVWRQLRDPGSVRLLYRMLGACFVPMRARRRLLFPERCSPS